MPSTVIKRSIVVAGHKTSVSLEDSFWIGLKEIARDSHLTLSKLVNKVDTERVNANLSSALRVYVFQHFAEDKRTDAVKPTRCMRPFSSIGYGKSLCRVAGGNAHAAGGCSRVVLGSGRGVIRRKTIRAGDAARRVAQAADRLRKISHESGRICGLSFRT